MGAEVDNRKKYLDKVTKLLAITKDKAANATEAATALRLAETLMRKHDINFAEIEANTLKSEDLQRLHSRLYSGGALACSSVPGVGAAKEA